MTHSEREIRTEEVSERLDATMASSDDGERMKGRTGLRHLIINSSKSRSHLVGEGSSDLEEEEGRRLDELEREK